MKTIADPSTEPKPEPTAAPVAPTPRPVSISGLAALTEDEAARFQQDASPHDIKADLRNTDEPGAGILGFVSEDAFLQGRVVRVPEECREGKLIAAAMLELFKVSGHPVPAHLAPGLRELSERGYLK